MKVSFVTDYFPDVHDKWFGAEMACKRLFELLSGGYEPPRYRGYEPRRDGGSADITVYTSKVHRKGKAPGYIKEVPILEDGLKQAGFSLKTAFPFDPIAYRYFSRAFMKERPDIVHLHNIKYMSFAPAVAARGLGIPVVFSVYDNWSLCPKYTLLDKGNNICRDFHGLRCLKCVPAKKKPFVLFRKRIFDYFLGMVDAFAVLTESEKSNFIKAGIAPEKINILPLPLSPRLAGAEVEEAAVERNTLLFVGRIEFGKGLHVLVDAMPHVLERFGGARVVVAGEHSGNETYKRRVMKQIEGLGLGHVFKFVGKKGNEEVMELLRRAHIAVVPEQWAIAWPIFLTEAMAMGKVIVASRIGDIPSFIEHGKTGYLTDPKDPEDLARWLNHALGEGRLLNRECPGKVRSICDAARVRRETLRIYGKVAGGPRAHWGFLKGGEAVR